MSNNETILQSLKRIEDVIYNIEYDSLPSHLQGVRDMINLVNGEECNESIADFIVASYKVAYIKATRKEK